MSIQKKTPWNRILYGSLMQILVRKTEKNPRLIEIELNEDEIGTIISILDFSCTA
ncbi:MAG: hypothetical protein KGI11_09340 [Thaumarchaeota archaeon]|nr:hypothetical protein [Nitrososphaerota archaeon]